MRYSLFDQKGSDKVLEPDMDVLVSDADFGVPAPMVMDLDQVVASAKPSDEGANLSATLPVYNHDQIADYLVYDWLGGAKFAVAPGGTLTVNITGLTADGQFLALSALEAWTMVTGINFATTALSADITFDDEASGAFAGPDAYSGQGGTIYSSSVNVSTGWIATYGTTINSYSFQTYVHEIGHALGLGHAGNYNGTATYAEDGSGDNHYLNDSWQATIMSYFDTNENTYIDASKRYLMTPMIADILAMQELYGVAGNLRIGDTIYGQGSTAGGYYDTEIQAGRAFTLIDDGGTDTIDFSSATASQTVNLAAESISDVGGYIGNMSIARGTVIENFYSGSGHDTITGNGASNLVRAGGGNDVVFGRQGDDNLHGGDGDDILKGNTGRDSLRGNQGNDILRGGGGADKIWGGAGNDRIIGGDGRDKLHGGNGADTFVFKNDFSVDRIRDFEDDIDTVRLEDIWGGSMSVADILNETTGFGGYNATNGFFELDFGNGNKITFEGVFNGNILLDDLVLI